jgi:amidase
MLRALLTCHPFIQCMHEQNRYKEQFCDAWDKTAEQTTSGRPIDGLICPPGASAGYPHDFLPWWGYTTLFNILDYPSTILPLKNFKVSKDLDSKDSRGSYKPQTNNPFDKLNYDMCK